MKSQVQKYYNSMYKNGIELIEGCFYKNLKVFELHRKDAAFKLIKKGEKMLDIACGEGELCILAKQKFTQVFGIDISDDRINYAKKKLINDKTKDIIFSVQDANQGLKFKNNFFDTVTAIAALAFFFDPDYLVAEINRVLKKKGELVIEVPNIAYLPRRISLLFGNLPKVSATNLGWDGGHLHYFTQSTLIELLKSKDFKIVKVTGSGIFAHLRNWYPSLLCGNIIVKAVKK